MITSNSKLPLQSQRPSIETKLSKLLLLNLLMKFPMSDKCEY